MHVSLLGNGSPESRGGGEQGGKIGKEEEPEQVYDI